MATPSSPRRRRSARIWRERHPTLNVPVGDPRRGAYLKWLFFGPSCTEPAMMDHMFPRKDTPPRAALGYGDYDTVVEVLAQAVKSGPYLLGEQFTAADVVIGSGLRFGIVCKGRPGAPAVLALCDA